MIEFKQVSKNFGEIQALRGLSFTINRGQIIGLLGPNGAGKTTTLRIMAGVLPPSEGQVTLNGQNFVQENQNLKEMIGFLPENNPLYEEMTVEEYLKFWGGIKGLAGGRLEEALEFAVNSTHIKEVFFRPIAEISKGFRQRAGLAQALLTRPPILILDEPTEGLDPNQRRDIKDLIVKLGKERTVVISSHVLTEISQIANRIIIIHQGKKVADDTVVNLKNFQQGGQVVETEIQGRGVKTALNKLPGVKNVTETKPTYFRLTSDTGKDIRPQIFSLAKEKGWILLTLAAKEQQLEDVFTELTKD